MNRNTSKNNITVLNIILMFLKGEFWGKTSFFVVIKLLIQSELQSGAGFLNGPYGDNSVNLSIFKGTKSLLAT